jgi:hypothetical protein
MTCCTGVTFCDAASHRPAQGAWTSGSTQLAQVAAQSGGQGSMDAKSEAKKIAFDRTGSGEKILLSVHCPVFPRRHEAQPIYSSVPLLNSDQPDKLGFVAHQLFAFRTSSNGLFSRSSAPRFGAVRPSSWSSWPYVISSACSSALSSAQS